MGIYLSNHRYEEIKESVVCLFSEYDISCVPISGFEIAMKMGVSVKPYSAYPSTVRSLLMKESADGFCVEGEDGDWHIYYNDEVGYGRINNTLMHEVGHIVLEHSEDSKLADTEANFFAKYALVPPVLLHKFNLDTPEEISEMFGVSFEAACYAKDYYNKWLQYGNKEYEPYECELLELFSNAG